MLPLVRRCLLLLLLLPVAAWAQQTADSSVSTAEEQPAAEEQIPGKEPEVEVTPGSGAEQPPEETVSESGSVTPPDEYRASEQISDDLSVSFPVDI